MFLITFEGMRLCQDNAWRVFANYGTYPECVKEYRYLGHARRKAKRVGGRVARVPNGMDIDAAGHVIDNGKIRLLQEFVV